MSKSPKNKARGAIIVLAALCLLIGAAFAFTAANTVPASKAGDGSGAITGYTASNIHYTLNGVDPTVIDAVNFDVDSVPVAGSTIRVQLVSAGGTWFTCTNLAVAITCDTSGAPVAVLAADSLRVVIAD